MKHCRVDLRSFDDGRLEAYDIDALVNALGADGVERLAETGSLEPHQDHVNCPLPDRDIPATEKSTVNE